MSRFVGAILWAVDHDSLAHAVSKIMVLQVDVNGSSHCVDLMKLHSRFSVLGSARA